jgi:hypothetical protein
MFDEGIARMFAELRMADAAVTEKKSVGDVQ